MGNYMMNRNSIIKDVNGCIVAPGDLIFRIGVHQGNPSVESVVYKVLFPIPDKRMVAIEAVNDSHPPFMAISFDALHAMYEVAMCSACGEKLAVKPLEVHSLIIDVAERQRCNSCKFRLLVEHFADQVQGGETP